jgi:hypothetical protein
MAATVDVVVVSDAETAVEAAAASQQMETKDASSQAFRVGVAAEAGARLSAGVGAGVFAWDRLESGGCLCSCEEDRVCQPRTRAGEVNRQDKDGTYCM